MCKIYLSRILRVFHMRHLKEKTVKQSFPFSFDEGLVCCVQFSSVPICKFNNLVEPYIGYFSIASQIK